MSSKKQWKGEVHFHSAQRHHCKLEKGACTTSPEWPHVVSKYVPLSPGVPQQGVLSLPCFAVSERDEGILLFVVGLQGHLVSALPHMDVLSNV